jgi:hypothetical protein
MVTILRLIPLALLPAALIPSFLSRQASDEISPTVSLVEIASVRRLLATGDIDAPPAWSPSQSYIVVGCRTAEGHNVVRRLSAGSGRSRTIYDLPDEKAISQIAWDPKLGVVLYLTDSPWDRNGVIRQADASVAPLVVDVRSAEIRSGGMTFMDSGGKSWTRWDDGWVDLSGEDALGATIQATEQHELRLDLSEDVPALCLYSVSGGTLTPTWRHPWPRVGAKANDPVQFSVVDAGICAASWPSDKSVPLIDSRGHTTFTEPTSVRISERGIEPLTRLPAVLPSLSPDGDLVAYLTVTPMRAGGFEKPIAYVALWVEDLRTSIPVLAAENVDALPAVWSRDASQLAYVSSGDLYVASVSRKQVSRNEAKRYLLTYDEREQVTKASSNMKQLGLAMRMYMNDYDEQLPNATNETELVELLEPYVKSRAVLDELVSGAFWFDFPQPDEQYDPSSQGLATFQYYAPSARVTVLVTIYADGHVGVEYR